MDKQSNNLSDWYDELFAKTDLVRLISSYVQLKKKGVTWWGCCPFHHEKTPSFTVSETKQVYHCFGCGEGGNATTFIQKIESVDKAEAIKLLAKAAGMELPALNFIKSDDTELIKKREKLYTLMREAAKHYHENLFSGRAKLASDYLNSRKIDKNLAIKFGLGYSIDGRTVIEHLEKLGYTKEEMKAAGIAENGANGWYDVFYDRLIIPIINTFKEVVAFGGRTLKPNSNFAKYRNSSQTIIFDKSKTIYGLNIVKNVKLHKNIEYIIMTEGYMDVIMLHKAGFDTAVASMGTALTLNQARQLKNICEKVYISYDGDAAGQKAAMRGLDILANAGLAVKVITLPENMDPDDVIKQKGKEFYQQLIDTALTLPAFKIEMLKKKYDLSESDQKAKFAVEAIAVIKALPNPVEREEYLTIVQSYTNYSMDALLAQADITVVENVQPQTHSKDEDALKEQKFSKEENSKRFILACLAKDREFVDYDEDFEVIIDDVFYRELINYFIDSKRHDKKAVSVLYDRIDVSEHKRLDAVLNYDFVKGDNADKYKDCIRTLKLGNLQSSLDAATEKYNNGNKSALQEIASLTKKLNDLKSGNEQ